jgi:hypothetical protein
MNQIEDRLIDATVILQNSVAAASAAYSPSQLFVSVVVVATRLPKAVATTTTTCQCVN